ncbi:MAG TPA: 4-hydroxythreonine-4-phosphate dehydrogenase PdxA [Acetobacteraceae bacterium]|nr:4-hydroxythreonine-4-phosphate dehydrogenase PdxA [Acetobacteraceae bacterium]
MSRLAITMGDPAGVGPEIIVKACRRLAPRIESGTLRLLVIGHQSALNAARTLLQDNLEFATDPEAGLAFLAAGEEAEPIRFGAIAPEAGRFAYLAVAKAVRLARAGRIDAIVTAPLNKEALNLAGYHYAGHTDMLAALTETRSSVMLLAHGDMRVGHVTTHVALADVPRLLTPERLRRTIDLTHAAVRDLGIAAPRVAVAALNPHAGEGGLFGRQDIEITTPVVEQCRTDGMDVTGPVPGDTVFVKLRARQFDAVVAMYHDQGHIPVKLLGFDVDPATGTWRALSGVNITLGLPVIRTSVDHGTAFDIAGKGIASEESLIEAIDYAERLAANRAASV